MASKRLAAPMGSQPCAVCHCGDSSQQDHANCKKTTPESAWREEQVAAKALQPTMAKQQNILAPLPQAASQKTHPIGSIASGEPHRHPAAEDTRQPAELALSFHLAVGVDLGMELAEAQGPSGSLLVVADITPQSPLACVAQGFLPVVAGDVIMNGATCKDTRAQGFPPVVNGHRASAANLRAAMEQVAATGGQLRLDVLPRPAHFEVRLQRVEGSKLGLLVAMDRADPDRIAVRAVRAEGDVPDWNALNACLRVVAGDWITQVNGRSRGAQEMYSDFTASDGAELRIRIMTTPRLAA